MPKNHITNIEDRLHTYIRRTSTCWIWTGYKGHYGYGKVTDDDGKQVRAHRYLYEMFKGKIPKGMNVLHKCDNTACVNPEHLFLGSQKDNVKDMMSKGRGGYKKFCGEAHHNRKLDMNKVKKMREMWESKKYSQYQIASKFNISQQVVSKVVNYKAWLENGSFIIKSI